HRTRGHGLSERYRRALDMAAAVWANGCLPTRRELLLDPAQLIALRACEAGCVGIVAMQLDHVRRRNSRALMQVVDVLRHHAGSFAGPIQTCQRKMAASGTGRGKMLLHGEAAPPGFVARLLA